MQPDNSPENLSAPMTQDNSSLPDAQSIESNVYFPLLNKIVQISSSIEIPTEINKTVEDFAYDPYSQSLDVLLFKDLQASDPSADLS